MHFGARDHNLSWEQGLTEQAAAQVLGQGGRGRGKSLYKAGALGMGYGSVISSLTQFKLSIATQPSVLWTGPGGICPHTVLSGKNQSRMWHSILGTQTSTSHLLPSAGHWLCVNLSRPPCLVGWDPQAI